LDIGGILAVHVLQQLDLKKGLIVKQSLLFN
jgi:hypothetical protein